MAHEARMVLSTRVSISGGYPSRMIPCVTNFLRARVWLRLSEKGKAKSFVLNHSDVLG